MIGCFLKKAIIHTKIFFTRVLLLHYGNITAFYLQTYKFNLTNKTCLIVFYKRKTRHNLMRRVLLNLIISYRIIIFCTIVLPSTSAFTTYMPACKFNSTEDTLHSLATTTPIKL